VRLGRGAVALCAMTAVVTAVVLALVGKHHSFVDRSVAVVPLAWAALAGIMTWWLRGREARAIGTTAAQAEAAITWLTGEIASRWRQEAAARRIVTPAPASVRWRWGAAELSVPVQDAVAPPAPGTGPVPFPSLTRPAELLTTGVVTRLHDEVYARLPHGRLVLVGGPGSGKTGAMILLLLAALDRRAMMADGPRSLVPVPVWLTMGGWDSLSVPLADWVTGVLNRDYPALRAAQYGDNAAGMLLRSGRLALFLDGLDEMPPDLQTAAVRRLNSEGSNLRMVLTSRPAEYRLALKDFGLDNAAVIELRPVRPAAAAAYLLLGQSGPARARWQSLADHLRANPSSVLASALSNPLALSLAREAYTNDDPSVLADTRKFPTTEAITGQLIDQFLRSAYPDERRRAHAVRWLSWIAVRMGNSQDLRWWDIPAWVPRWRLRLARGLLAGAAAWPVVTLAAWLTYRQVTATASAPGMAAWIAPGYAIGMAVAVVAGLVFPLQTAPAALPSREPGCTHPAAADGSHDSFRKTTISSSGLWDFTQRKRTLALVATGAVVIIAGAAFIIPFVALGVIVTLTTRRGKAAVRNHWRRVLAYLLAVLLRGALLGMAAGIAAGLWAVSLDADWVTAAGAGFIDGTYLSLPALVLGTRGFGRIGVPRSLTPRWPRPAWLFPLWLVLSPLLIPRWLTRWATPAADSPSATAASTYQADRRTSVVYASVYAVLLAIPFIIIAFALLFILGPASSPVAAFRYTALLWLGVIAAVTWCTTWFGAGQVPLVHLAQLVLLPRRGRVSFRRLLDDALDRQVLRQAGAVYQFRHAALQNHLTDGTLNATATVPCVQYKPSRRYEPVRYDTDSSASISALDGEYRDGPEFYR
jgi:hypothetical protein